MPTVRAAEESIDGGRNKDMNDYREQYRQKLTDAASLAARVENGWVIGMDAATAHTPKIMSAIAARADAVFEVVAGIPIRLKGELLRRKSGWIVPLRYTGRRHGWPTCLR